MLRYRSSVLAVACALAFVCTPPTEAQTQGRVSGEVVDQEGNPVPDAQVVVSATDRAFTADTTTGKRGKFVLTLLDATWGYTIRIEKDGFQVLEEPLKPNVGGLTAGSWTLVSAAAAAPGQTGAAAPAVGADTEGLELETDIDGPRAVVRAYEGGAKSFAEGDFEGAIEKFNKALELAPELKEGHHALAMTYFNMERNEDALAAADRFLEFGEDNFDIQIVRYDALVNLERFEESAALLETLLEAYPGAPIARRAFNLGVKRFREGASGEAIDWMSKATVADPELMQAHRVLAQLLASERRFEEALASADRALELEPQDPDGLLVRYEALRGLGRESEGEESLDNLKTTDPDRYVVTFMRVGTQEFELGQNEAAIRSFRRVLDVQPDHPRGNYRLGVALVSAGQPEAGRPHLERFIELAPDDPEVAVAREMLSFLE